MSKGECEAVDPSVASDRGEQLHLRPHHLRPFRDHQYVGDHAQVGPDQAGQIPANVATRRLMKERWLIAKSKDVRAVRLLPAPDRHLA